jgi:lipopolysaccharide/colanic/teichoic acid biosynthesis glycosyltransferase
VKTLLADTGKRLFDLFFSFLGVLLLAPILVLIAMLIKLASPGPVLYQGLRIGRFGRPFRILKFRTMVVDAERRGGSATAEDDPRLTPIGKFLRRYKLDELPQLGNVLTGDMSFVGPRPEVQKYVERYTEREKGILKLRPGITDWASIWNSNEAAVLKGSSDPEKAYEELILPTKVMLQLKYLQDHSFLTDLRILFHTFAKLLREDWVPQELRSYDKVRRYRVAASETTT